MAIPALLLNSRLIAFAGGLAVGVLSRSKVGKEMVSTLKTGVSGLMADLERDYSVNKQMVKDIKEGKVR